MTARTPRFVLALVTAFVLATAAGPPAHAAAPNAKSIVSFINLSGGQEVIVPNGVYTGGTVAAPHADWLVLRAATPGGVVVDLRDTGLKLNDGTSNVVFVGFTFVNGTVQLAGVHDVHFWYCDFSFTPDEWTRQYQQAGGRVPADHRMRDAITPRMANPFPTGARVREGVFDRSVLSERVGFWGSDFHDLADDGILLSGARGVSLVGLRIWNVDEKRSDPGQSLGSSQDWFHNDGIQTVGDIQDVHILDSWIGQKIQWGAEGRDIRDVEFRRLWYAGSSTFGEINEVKGSGRILNNTQQDIRVFANGQKNGPAFDGFQTDFVDGAQRAVWSRHYQKAGVFEIAATRVTLGAPAGVTVAGGRLTDINQVRNHRDNPANQWRQTHGYATWGSVLALG